MCDSFPRYDPSEKNPSRDDRSNAIRYQSEDEAGRPEVYFEYYSCNDKRPEKEHQPDEYLYES